MSAAAPASLACSAGRYRGCAVRDPQCDARRIQRKMHASMSTPVDAFHRTAHAVRVDCCTHTPRPGWGISYLKYTYTYTHTLQESELGSIASTFLFRRQTERSSGSRVNTDQGLRNKRLTPFERKTLFSFGLTRWYMGSDSSVGSWAMIASNVDSKYRCPPFLGTVGMPMHSHRLCLSASSAINSAAQTSDVSVFHSIREILFFSRGKLQII